MPRVPATEEVNTVAARMSSQVDEISRDARDFREGSPQWDAIKGRLARALVANPDIYYYLVWLASNRLRKTLADLLVELENLALMTEGRRLPNEIVPPDSGIRDALDAVAKGDAVTSAQISRLKKEVESSFPRLQRNFSAGGRITKKGIAAKSSYLESRNAVVGAWSQILRSISALSAPASVDLEVLKRVALTTPLANMGSSISVGYSDEYAYEYTMQLLGGIASIEMSNREVSLDHKLMVDDISTFPENVYILPSLNGTYVESFQITGPKLAVVSPMTLGIQIGDHLSWSGFETTVGAVSGTSVTLSDTSLVPRTAPIRVTVASQASRDFILMRKALGALNLPSTQSMMVTLDTQERSAAATRDLLFFIARVYSQLDSLSDNLQSSLDRVGASYPVSPEITARDALLNFSPTFSSSTKRAVTDVLDTLRSNGFDRAEDALLRGDVDMFFSMTYDLSSKIGAVKSLSAVTSDRMATSYSPSISSRGRR